MNKTTIYAIIAGCVLFAFLATFVGGCQYGKSRVRCATTTHDTILLHDTITHRIVDTLPYYIAVRDTIYQDVYVHEDIDTAAILKDYFSIHTYNRHWEDSLISVTIEDRITRNTPIHNEFKYKILRPLQIVNNLTDNTITYNRYVSIGLSVPITDMKYTELKMLFNTDKWYAGVGYMSQINSFTLHGGVTILKWGKEK